VKKWFLKNKVADFEKIVKKYNVNEVIARLMVNRDVVTDEAIDEYLNVSVARLHNPLLMKDMDKAVAIIGKSIRENKKIRVVGDYDVDGVTSTYILVEALKRCNARVDYEVPDRIKDGYGINISIIDKAINDGIECILTCDNGIAAIEQIKYAKDNNLTVVITDHHDILFEEKDGKKEWIMPNADAIVNPHRKDDNYPYENLCGAVIAFKFVQVLYNEFGIDDSESMEFLQYAAIATVCDVMELKKENRTIVKCGLKMMKNTSNLGLKALFEMNNIVDDISAYHLGFVIGPCFNATGRLSTAKRAIELLSTKDETKASELARQLKELNDDRKQMTNDNLEEALEMIENSSLKNDKVIVLYKEDCHESLAGIIAGRLRDRYSRPVIVITKGDTLAKGSARSTKEYNMFEELLKCEHLLSKFGGHPMAAGLSLEEKNIDLLRTKLNENTVLTDEDLIPKVSIDVLLPLGYVNEKLIDSLDLIEPCGKGNEKPIFAEKNIRVNKASVFGKNKNVLKLDITNQYNKRMDAVYFGDISQFNKFIKNKYGESELNKMYNGRVSDTLLSIIYYPSINEYNGIKNVQIVIKEFQ